MVNTMDYDLIREREGDDDEVFQLTIEYTYHRAYRGARSSLGVPEEPDEPAGIEIEAILDEDGNEFEVTDSEEEEIYEACLNNLEIQEWTQKR